MKAKWIAVAGMICILLGVVVPYAAVYMGMENVEGGFWDILAWIIITHGIYGYIGLFFIGIGIFLLIASVIVYARSK